MLHILSEITSILQYTNQYRKGNIKRLTCCPGCGRANPWPHGCYPRKSDRINSEGASLNPVLIQRYYCPGCRKTCSVLPECIPPRRWYLWETQQAAMLLFLSGCSARAVERQIKPSRQTVKRWIAWLMVQFKMHKDALSSHFPSFGLFTEPVGFWKRVFQTLPLSTAMRLCHVSGVPIP